MFSHIQISNYHLTTNTFCTNLVNFGDVFHASKSRSSCERLQFDVEFTHLKPPRQDLTLETMLSEILKSGPVFKPYKCIINYHQTSMFQLLTQ